YNEWKMARPLFIVSLALALVFPSPAAAARFAAVAGRATPCAAPGSVFLGFSTVAPRPELAAGAPRPGLGALPVAQPALSPAPSAGPALVAAPVAANPGPAASERALAQIEAARALLAVPEAGAAALAEPERWEGFWSLSRAAPAAAEPVVAEYRPRAPGALRPAPGGCAAARLVPPSGAPGPRRSPLATAVPLGLAGLWAAARFGLPVWLPALAAKAGAGVTAAGFGLAAYAAGRLLRAAASVLGRRLGWKPGTIVAARLAASLAAYAAGAALGLSALGVSSAALLASFGIGGVAMTMAAKEFIGNFLEGVKLLAHRPFVVGDRVRLTLGPAAEDFTVKDMSLRYVELSGSDGSVTMVTYTQLAQNPLTIYREYPSRRAGLAARPSESNQPGRLACWLWTALGLGLAAGLVVLPATAPLQAAAALGWLGWIQAAAAMLAARSLDKGAAGFIQRLALKRDWSPQTAVLVKLAVRLALHLAGGAVALRFIGMTWSTLLASLGATSIALGWASADIMGNLIQAFWLLLARPFGVGDRIEVAGVSGAVLDMNLSYVVLAGAGAAHALVPYAALQRSAFKVLADAAPGAFR
ncbi:MAG: mechanosensitive ion channel, partial [Elusimicrobia bacterium]|nr:mechanosensitive ion channel [Elusimicrobiota bacterium]